MTSSTETDLETRRKRVRFRAWHRGTKENDIMIGHYIDQNIDTLSHDDCAWFELLFEESDQDLQRWIMGFADVPEQFATPLMAAMQKLDYLPIKR